jgi:dTDP-4-amino-4,6-dideoxygalactose transaminase
MLPGALQIGKDEEQAVLSVLRSRALFRWDASPSQVRAFEEEFARRMQSPHALAVHSGTAALICGLVALKVGPGDEVIVPGYTWISTASAVIAVGAVPILAEIDDSLTLDPLDVERKISPRTRAIIPVHTHGVAASMDELLTLARDRGLLVLEDAAQAAGGAYRGRPLGSLGEAGAYSLQAYKNLTSGEGGVLVTKDRDTFLRAVGYHDHGSPPYFGISIDEWLPESILGLSMRMAELAGALARVQLARLDSTVEAMRRHKARLTQALRRLSRERGLGFRRLPDGDGETGQALVLFVPASELAARVTAALSAEGVPASLLFARETLDHHVYYFWRPILERRTPTGRPGPWDWLGHDVRYDREMCPRTLELLGRAVHIPVSPQLTGEQVDQIAEGVEKVVTSLV